MDFASPFFKHFRIIFLITTFCAEVILGDKACIPNNIFDYIIVGSGSTGAVIAARLSEDPDSRVLLLEAGGEPLPVSDVPLISFKALGTEMDWNYFTVKQKTCCKVYKQQRVPINRGKALGGTSSINYMTYTRGNRLDFDLWEMLGNPGWSHEEVFPYFLKLEDYQAPRSREDDLYHSEGGPMTVSIPTFKTPLADAFLQAGYELGHPLVDYNAKYQTGFMYPPVTTRNGARCSTYTGYLKPNLKRTNLHVHSFAFVTKILIDSKKRATGVVYEKKGSKCSAKARREVIISAGVINSPQLLMLSGIGAKDTLQDLGITSVVDLPGVGMNLQDHVILGGMQYFVNQTISYNSVRFETQHYLDLWRKTRTGPMTTPESFEGVAYYRSKYSNFTDWPDIEIFFNSDNTAREFKPLIDPILAALLPSAEKDIISFIPILLRPKSRGTVTLQSSDPYEPPLIDPKYLSHPDDVKVLVEGLKFADQLANTKAFKQFGTKMINNGFVPNCIMHMVNSDAYDKCVVKTLTSSGYHLTSTCKMGPKSDPMSVVDHELKVYGIERLRVADASIMPTIVSAHPSTACMMIGEKISDIIKKEWDVKR